MRIEAFEDERSDPYVEEEGENSMRGLLLVQLGPFLRPLGEPSLGD